jgi:putative addiction module component (TIGR02574 family)
MRKITDLRGFDELSLPEKIELVQDLWDRIADEPEAVGVTEAQRQELERRLLAHEQNPGKYTSWEELRSRLTEKSQ